MRYIRTKDKAEANRLTNGQFDKVGSISRTGSVVGMQNIYGWEKNGQVRCGAWVHNIGVNAINTLKNHGLIRE